MGRLVPRRRPSAALIIALLALFVALGGPAGAAGLLNGKLLRKGSVTSKAIKNRSLTTRDISRRSVRALQTPRKGSITGAQLATGAVGPAAIARGGVLAGNLATGSVGSLQVANGSLTTADLARWSGRFSVDIPPIPAGQCWTREPVLAALDAARANIQGDVVEVTPDARWPRVKDAGRDYALSLTVYTSSAPSRFVLSVCNPGNRTGVAGNLPAATTRVGFSYAVLNVP
jgi:hypothetical protein